MEAANPLHFAACLYPDVLVDMTTSFRISQRPIPVAGLTDMHRSISATGHQTSPSVNGHCQTGKDNIRYLGTIWLTLVSKKANVIQFF